MTSRITLALPGGVQFSWMQLCRIHVASREEMTDHLKTAIFVVKKTPRRWRRIANFFTIRAADLLSMIGFIVIRWQWLRWRLEYSHSSCLVVSRLVPCFCSSGDQVHKTNERKTTEYYFARNHRCNFNLTSLGHANVQFSPECWPLHIEWSYSIKPRNSAKIRTLFNFQHILIELGKLKMKEKHL